MITYCLEAIRLLFIYGYGINKMCTNLDLRNRISVVVLVVLVLVVVVVLVLVAIALQFILVVVFSLFSVFFF